MKNSIITNFEQRMFSNRKTHPDFNPGDKIRVHYKIEEAAKTEGGESKFRLQIFEGICLRFKKGTVDSTFTVRKIGANNVGVERIFTLYSPFVDKIELISGGSVRRSRLYYLRERAGKAARIKARRLSQEEINGSVTVSQN